MCVHATTRTQQLAQHDATHTCEPHELPQRERGRLQADQDGVQRGRILCCWRGRAAGAGQAREHSSVLSVGAAEARRCGRASANMLRARSARPVLRTRRTRDDAHADDERAAVAHARRRDGVGALVDHERASDERQAGLQHKALARQRVGRQLQRARHRLACVELLSCVRVQGVWCEAAASARQGAGRASVQGRQQLGARAPPAPPHTLLHGCRCPRAPHTPRWPAPAS